jgi:hypothetical protein
MAAPLWLTPAQYKDDSIGDFKDPVTRLLAEIYNQLYISSMASTTPLPFTTDGTGSYTNAALVGKTIVGIFISVMLQDSDFTFDDATGEITWADAPATGINGLILYS